MEQSEILLIDKPVGITSFDVIRQLRRSYKDGGLPVPKLGHAGTLDPLASGLMIIGVGQGTKKLAELVKLDKEYVAEILLGRQTTTSDREGEVVAEREVGGIFYT
jgi:tRNA pseudouridine55 synthase